MAMKTVTFAKDAWKLLRGLGLIHKPADYGVENMKSRLASRLCEDLNIMQRGDHASEPEEAPCSTAVRQAYADHPLVLGQGFEKEDFEIDLVNNLSHRISGLSLVCINDNSLLRKWKSLRLPSVYRVTFVLGQSTDTLFTDGKILEKSYYKHLKNRPDKLTGILGSIQSFHQRVAMRSNRVSMNSQAAYEMAVRGVLRPEVEAEGHVYSFKLVSYELPEVVIDVLAFDVSDNFIAELVHEVGLKMRTNAVTESVRIMRLGFFTLKDCLPLRHWNVESIIENLGVVRQKLADNEDPFERRRHLTPIKEIPL